MAWMLIEELLKAGWVTLVGYFLKAMWRAAMVDRCKIKGCGAAVASGRRGLCLKCYGKAKARVEAGQVTWEQLEEKGLCEPQRDPFDDAYMKAMEDK